MCEHAILLYDLLITKHQIAFKLKVCKLIKAEEGRKYFGGWRGITLILTAGATGSTQKMFN